MTQTEQTLRDAVVELQRARKNLHRKFSRWDFTLDGNLVGDIGEAYAAAHFDLIPVPGNSKTHDFRTPDGRYVQVKMTQKKRMGLGLSEPEFDYFIALFLSEEGEIEVLYNGLGARVYEQDGKPPRSSVAVTILRKLDKQVEDLERIPRRNESEQLAEPYK